MSLREIGTIIMCLGIIIALIAGIMHFFNAILPFIITILIIDLIFVILMAWNSKDN